MGPIFFANISLGILFVYFFPQFSGQFLEKGEGPILLGQTPCCFDRLGELLCGRQKKANLGAFLHKCMQNADFAFVQCCRTCFTQNENDPFKLDYKKTSEFLLTNAETAKCRDRRGENWCEKFVWGDLGISEKRNWDWRRKNAQKLMECGNVPIAFRICRKSCGFCATQDSPAKAVYEERVAKSVDQCYSPARGMAVERKDLAENSVYRDFVNRFAERKRKAKKRGEMWTEWKERRNGNGEFGIRPKFWINEGK